MVFERSFGQLEDQGAGIVSPFPNLERLKKRDLIDQDYSVVPMDSAVWTMPDLDGIRGGSVTFSDRKSGQLLR